MKRREFITLVGSTVAVWPCTVRAQQPALPVVGFLNLTSRDQDQGRVHAFLQGLGEAGYVEGRNVLIAYRWADDQHDRLQALATDLVSRQVNVIAAAGDGAALAAKSATATIPIVFSGGNDPVKLGLVASLNRPGANLTGVVNLNIQLNAKRFELLHELVPEAKVVALLVNPTNPSAETISRELQAAVLKLGLKPQVIHASTETDFDMVFANLQSIQAGALVIGSDVFFITRSRQLAALTVGHAMPAVCQAREFAAAGGLISYGTNISDQYRLVGGYVGEILKGKTPNDLPVQQATKIELVINLKTAKMLGLTVPLPLLGRADEVIE
jgi:putative tryptophan/tyrosine transport system substrate-binding protein